MVSRHLEIKLEDCGCKWNSHGNNWFNQTTCGKDAFSRGMGQKITRTSIYGDYTMKRLYIITLLLELILQHILFLNYYL